MRTITDHKLNGLNDALEITVLDEPGQGGACHEYEIEFGNSDGSDQTAVDAALLNAVADTLLSHPSWVTGQVDDLATQLALNDDRTNGKWKPDDTFDGVHLTPAGYGACSIASTLAAVEDFANFMPQS